MSTPTTTLAKIKAANPCASSWHRALKKTGGLRKYGADTPITMRQIVEAMGLDDALWCLRTMPEHNTRWRLLTVRYARRMQRLMKDPRSVAALDVAERHAHGLATDEDLAAARLAARAASDAILAGGRLGIAVCVARLAADTTANIAEAAAAAAFGDAASSAAAEAASDAEREWQAAELIRICEEEQ